MALTSIAWKGFAWKFMAWHCIAWACNAWEPSGTPLGIHVEIHWKSDWASIGHTLKNLGKSSENALKNHCDSIWTPIADPLILQCASTENPLGNHLGTHRECIAIALEIHWEPIAHPMKICWCIHWRNPFENSFGNPLRIHSEPIWEAIENPCLGIHYKCIGDSMATPLRIHWESMWHPLKDPLTKQWECNEIDLDSVGGPSGIYFGFH